jgi:hypothetical protein
VLSGEAVSTDFIAFGLNQTHHLPHANHYIKMWFRRRQGNNEKDFYIFLPSIKKVIDRPTGLCSFS